MQILTTYVQHTFGTPGSLLLAVVITLACLTTAVADHRLWRVLRALLPVSYRSVVIVFALFSLLVANQGLTQLISVSVPVLVGLYPLAIVLVALSLLDRFWLSSSRLRARDVVTLVFGVVDGLAAAGLRLGAGAVHAAAAGGSEHGLVGSGSGDVGTWRSSDRLLGRAERVQHRA